METGHNLGSFIFIAILTPYSDENRGQQDRPEESTAFPVRPSKMKWYR